MLALKRLVSRLLRYIDKYRYFLNIDISILNISMYRNIEKYRFFDKQLLFNSYIYNHHNVFQYALF